MKSKIVPACLLIAILVLTAGIYWPGLHSPFYLDDFVNLGRLSDIQKDGFANFIFGGIGFPGRPVSLLTFALQHSSWPDDPFSFKLVNLIIHLCNGILIYYICLFLVKKVCLPPSRHKTVSLLITGIWLVHPMHITTNLYVIQRMTSLSTFFVLLGLAGYLAARDYYTENGSKKSLWSMVVIVAACLILSVLCKENGILLAVYILVIETTLYQQEKKPGELKLALWSISWAPVIALSGYLIFIFGRISHQYYVRHFTMLERLMTESRILLAYAGDILLPRIGQYNLYHDDYVVSTSLLNPPSTMISIIIIITGFLAAVFLRHKYNKFSFAVLWFLGGHLLESTFINLELYFEHRNYLPSLGLIFGMVFLLIYVSDRLNKKYSMLILSSLVLCGTAVISFAETSVWNTPLIQAQDWLRKHPQSKRTINQIGSFYIDQGNLDKAIELYENYEKQFPDDLYTRLRLLHIDACLKEKVYTDEQWEELFNIAERAQRDGYNVVTEFDTIVYDLHKYSCSALNLGKFALLLLKVMQNPNFKVDIAFLHEFMATLSLKMKDLNAAIINISEALRLAPSSQRYGYKIELLLSIPDMANAKYALDDFRKYLRRNPKIFLSG